MEDEWTNLEFVNVLRSLALIVLLDEQGQLTLLVGGRDRSVRADNGPALGVIESLGVGGLDKEAGSNRD